VFSLSKIEEVTMKEVVIGLDIGTSSAKAGVFDGQGNVILEATHPYDVVRPKPGWVEQDPETWWTAVKMLSKKLMPRLSAEGMEVRGVAITHQRLTFVPVDGHCKPVRRAILWNDIRCTQEAGWVAKNVGAEGVFRETGCPPGLWTVYKILWLKRNEPSVFNRTWKILLVPDYVTFKLTGNIVTTQSAAVLTGALDIERLDTWNSAFLDAIGVPKTIFVETILPGCRIAGKVTKMAASETGLPVGTPIVTAAGDQPCGSLGAGLTAPGKIAVNGGTSCTTELLCRKLPPRREADYFIEVSPGGDYVLENSVYSGGSALMNWYKATFSFPKTNSDQNVWSLIYGLAQNVSPGSAGMVLVPFFGGAGAPYWDLNARGAIVGLCLDHTSAHFVRAIMEGLAYEVRRSTNLLRKATGEDVAEVLMYGGSSKSSTWNQIFADVLGLKVTVPMTAETTALGAAMCAAVACGLHASLAEAAKNMVHTKQSFAPDPRRQQFYNAFYTQVYDGLYDSLAERIRAAIDLIQEHEMV